MKFSVSSDELLSALKKAIRVIEPKSTLPILECAVFCKRGDEYYIKAASAENMVIAPIKLVEIEDYRPFAFSLKNTLDVVSGLNGMVLNVTVEENFEVIIDYTIGTTRFMGVDPTPFPSEKEADTSIELEGGIIKKMNALSFAISDDEIRRILCTVCYDGDNLVATDGKAMAYIPTETKIDQTLIIPKSLISVMTESFNAEQPIKCGVTDTHIILEQGADKIVGTKIDGSYVKWQTLVPSSFISTAMVSTNSLLNAVRRVSKVAGESGLLRVEMHNEVLTLSCCDTERSRSTEEKVMCAKAEGQFEIGVNWKYLLAAVQKSSSEYLTIGFNDSVRPLMLEEENGFKVILMPMRLV